MYLQILKIHYIHLIYKIDGISNCRSHLEHLPFISHTLSNILCNTYSKSFYLIQWIKMR